MKIFELPEMEIAMFDENVVTTASGGDTPAGGNSLTRGAGGTAGNDILSDTVSTYSIGYEAIDMGV